MKAAKDFLTGNITEEEEEKIEPLEVFVKNLEKTKEIQTSEDEIDIYDIQITPEEQKEMEDAQ